MTAEITSRLLSSFSKLMIINVNHNLLTLESPRIMGILNFTDDSFYDGGKYTSESDLLHQTEKLLSEGADIIDIGVASTRPGAQNIAPEQELKKVEFLLKLILKNFPKTIISVDTWRAQVAERAVKEGAALINDISGGTFDSEMAPTIGRLNVPYCLMHTTGYPTTMQQNTLIAPILPKMLQFFGKQIELFQQNGCKDIILDPGFGFGKTIEQNFFILNNLSAFQIFERPLLIGLSRKSMIYKLLKNSPAEALNGTSVLNTVALQNGANILRVHDVKEAVETVKLMRQLELCTHEIVEKR